MALWVCTACTCRFSVGAPRCPQCGGTDHVDEGAVPMPKITVHGGPSIAGASVVGGSWSNDGDPDVWPPAEEGGEESSPGSSSSTSAETPENDSEPTSKPTPKPARTTGSRSSKARTAKGSTARSTAGDPETGTSATD